MKSTGIRVFLEFEVQRTTGRDAIEYLVELGDARVRGRAVFGAKTGRARASGSVRSASLRGVVAEAWQVGVVDDHDSAVGGPAQVELDPVDPDPDRALEGPDRIFRRLQAGSAMSDDGRHLDPVRKVVPTPARVQGMGRKRVHRGLRHQKPPAMAKSDQSLCDARPLFS